MTIIPDSLKSFSTQGVNVSLKFHYLESYFDFFSLDLDKISDEQGESFQVITL